MKKIFLIPVFFFAAFVAAVYLVMPQFKNYQTAKQKVARADVRLQELKSYVQQLEGVSGNLEKYKTEIAKIDSALPEDPSLSSVLNFFQQKASENGVTLVNVGLAQVPKKAIALSQTDSEKKELVSPLQEYKISITALATTPALENFLKTIENSARLIEVKSLSISEKGKASSGALKEYSVSASVYSYAANPIN